MKEKKRNSQKGKRKQENVWKDGKNKCCLKLEIGKNLTWNVQMDGPRARPK